MQNLLNMSNRNVFPRLRSYIHFAYDNYKDLKKGLIATIRDKPEECIENITRKMEYTEKKSAVFKSYSNDEY